MSRPPADIRARVRMASALTREAAERMAASDAVQTRAYNTRGKIVIDYNPRRAHAPDGPHSHLSWEVAIIYPLPAEAH